MLEIPVATKIVPILLAGMLYFNIVNLDYVDELSSKTTVIPDNKYGYSYYIHPRNPFSNTAEVEIKVNPDGDKVEWIIVSRKNGKSIAYWNGGIPEIDNPAAVANNNLETEDYDAFTTLISNEEKSLIEKLISKRIKK